MKYKFNLLTALFVAIICTLSACSSEHSISVSDNTTTEISATFQPVITSGTENTTTETSTSTTHATTIKSDTELKLIEMSKKPLTDYTSDDFKFLLNTDRTSFVKAFNLILNDGDGSPGSDGWYQRDGVTMSTYIIVNVPIKQISLDIMPPASYSPEEYLKPSTDKACALFIALYPEDMLLGKIKYGMTMAEASKELIGSEVVPFMEGCWQQGFFVDYKHDGLNYDLSFPENNNNELTDVYITNYNDN